MQELGLGAGLGAVAFWGFLAAVVGFGIWHDIRRRDSQQETVRRLIESGQPVDPAVLDKLLGGDKRLDRSLRAGGLVVLFTAPGVAAMGWFLSYLAAWALLPLLGAAALVGCIGIGLLVASVAIARSLREDDGPAPL